MAVPSTISVCRHDAPNARQSYLSARGGIFSGARLADMMAIGADVGPPLFSPFQPFVGFGQTCAGCRQCRPDARASSSGIKAQDRPGISASLAERSNGGRSYATWAYAPVTQFTCISRSIASLPLLQNTS